MTDNAPEMPDDAETSDEALTLEQLLADKDAQLAEANERLLRQVAETENVRKRLEKEKQDAAAYAMTTFARDMLAVADNLGRALGAVPEAARTDAAVNTVIVGVEMTEQELLSVFSRYGVTRHESAGERFDPNLHQAMAEVETADQEPGTVVQVFQPAYTIKDRLLRPAMVTVARAPAGAEPASGQPGSRIDTSA